MTLTPQKLTAGTMPVAEIDGRTVVVDDLPPLTARLFVAENSTSDAKKQPAGLITAQRIADVQRFIDQSVLALAATQEGVHISDQQVADANKKLRSRFASEVEYQAYVNGFKQKALDVEKKLHEELLISKLAEVRTEVTDQDVDEYFERHSAQLVARLEDAAGQDKSALIVRLRPRIEENIVRRRLNTARSATLVTLRRQYGVKNLLIEDAQKIRDAQQAAFGTSVFGSAHTSSASPPPPSNTKSSGIKRP